MKFNATELDINKQIKDFVVKGKKTSLEITIDPSKVQGDIGWHKFTKNYSPVGHRGDPVFVVAHQISPLKCLFKTKFDKAENIFPVNRNRWNNVHCSLSKEYKENEFNQVLLQMDEFNQAKLTKESVDQQFPSTFIDRVYTKNGWKNRYRSHFPFYLRKRLIDLSLSS
jgi:hypothetical protein